MPDIETEVAALDPAAVQAALAILRDIPLEKVQEIVKKRRADEKAAKLEASLVTPFPVYSKAPDDVDALNFEYGLELAFRPKSNPKKLTAIKLAPVMHVKPFLAKPRERNSDRRYYTGTTCVLQHMFEDMVQKSAEHIGAKVGSKALSSCSEYEIEFTSPIMERLSQVGWYYALVRKIADTVGATVDTETTNSGGGHIHVSPQGPAPDDLGYGGALWEDWQKAAVLIGVCENPWLSWIFNDPDDKTTAMAPNLTVIKAMFDSYKDSTTWYDNLERRLGDMAVRYSSQRKPTLEFRMMGAPQNGTEQLAQVQFLDRWIASLIRADDVEEKIKQHPALTYMLPHQFMDITFDFALGKFKDLLAQLDLPYEQFEGFVTRNMKKRYDAGWLRN